MNRQLALERNVKGVRARTAGLVRPRVPSEELARRPSATGSDGRPTNPTDCAWTTRTLGDVADIWNGATPSTQIPAYWDGTIPFVTPTDVTETSGKYLDASARRITTEGLSSCPARLLPVGTILVCSRATIGEIKIATTPLCTNQGFKSLVCRETVSNEFVYYLLLTLKPRMVERATGSTFLEIDRRQIASIEAKFPPPAEQHAVAEALSDVDGLLEALETLIAKKRATARATMQRLLTGKARLPGFHSRWNSTVLVRVGSAYGGLSGKTKADFGSGNARYVTFLGVLNNVTIDARHTDQVRVATHETQNVVQQGDLLFNGTSETPGDLAMGAVVGAQIESLYLNSFCFGPFAFTTRTDMSHCFSHISSGDRPDGIS